MRLRYEGSLTFGREKVRVWGERERREGTSGSRTNEPFFDLSLFLIEEGRAFFF